MKVPVWTLPNPYITNIWETKEQLTKDHVTKALQIGLSKSIPLLEFEDHADTELHAARVAYFVMNGWSELIEVVIQATDQDEEYIFCCDGNHRLAAALYLGYDEVNCLHNESVKKYLQEKGL